MIKDKTKLKILLLMHVKDKIPRKYCVSFMFALFVDNLKFLCVRLS